MAKIYAQLNSANICIGISQLSGEVDSPSLVPLDSFDESKIWKKYENGVWSVESYEPQSTAPLTEFEQIKQQLQATQEAVDFLLMGGM